MRTYVSMGLCALLFGSFATTALAGNVDECEVLKGGTPGLYGLCIAYANASDENARKRIEANYLKKMELGDPTLQQVFGEGATCPCWDEVRLLTDACSWPVTDTPPMSVRLSNGLVQYFNFGSQCVYSNFSTGVVIGFPTDADESETCQVGMDMLASGELLLDPGCP